MSNVYLPRLVSQKYDATMDYHITMYDTLPYKRNSDFCGARQVAMYSGHIIKYYLCLNQDDSYEVDNRDDKIETILAAVARHEAKRAKKIIPEITEDSQQSGITQEQIKTLLDDNDTFNQDGFADDNEPTGPTVNAFEGVEDW